MDLTDGADEVWDVGLKHGNIKLLGGMAFFIPMISAILLIVAGAYWIGVLQQLPF
ncbi:hypothetical protein [Phyllobacterium zundukense]|uniref:hypothetical protein n=1 Tax=Phyllobacterium zundukense TaxID=1867719 RepID=UPI0012FFE378|nr:hypothetical protein [Phyllobacterium zundukense]